MMEGMRTGEQSEAEKGNKRSRWRDGAMANHRRRGDRGGGKTE